MAKKMYSLRIEMGNNPAASLMTTSTRILSPTQTAMIQVRSKSPSGALAQKREQARKMRETKNIIGLGASISTALQSQSPIVMTQSPNLKAQNLAIAREEKKTKSTIRSIAGDVLDTLEQQSPLVITKGPEYRENILAVAREKKAHIKDVREQITQTLETTKQTKAEIKANRQAAAQKARDIRDIDLDKVPPKHGSSHVTAINYNEDSLKLYVEFNNTALYEYNLANHPYGAALGDIVMEGLEWCRTDDPTGQNRWWKYKQPSHGAAVYWDLYKRGVPYKRIR